MDFYLTAEGKEERGETTRKGVGAGNGKFRLMLYK